MTGRYQHPSRTFILRFEDMPGLEVVMRSASIGTLMDMAAVADKVAAGKASAPETLGLFTEFARQLSSWNLDGEDGQPVPATLDGVRSLDADLFLVIFGAWFEGMTSAPKAPPKPSPNGSAHLAESLPMATLPVSQGS
jgi:hypothetical protein